MKVTTGVLLRSIEPLNALSQEPIFGGASARINRLKHEMSPAIKAYNEVKDKLLAKYEVDGVIPEDKTEEVNKEYVDLLNDEVTIKFDTVDRKYLENDYIRISPANLELLDWIIPGEDDGKK